MKTVKIMLVLSLVLLSGVVFAKSYSYVLSDENSYQIYSKEFDKTNITMLKTIDKGIICYHTFSTYGNVMNNLAISCVK